MHRLGNIHIFFFDIQLLLNAMRYPSCFVMSMHMTYTPSRLHHPKNHPSCRQPSRTPRGQTRPSSIRRLPAQQSLAHCQTFFFLNPTHPLLLEPAALHLAVPATLVLRGSLVVPDRNRHQLPFVVPRPYPRHQLLFHRRSPSLCPFRGVCMKQHAGFVPSQQSPNSCATRPTGLNERRCSGVRPYFLIAALCSGVP